MLVQSDLDKLSKWESQNNMKFNFGKFKWLQFRVRPKSHINYNYFGPNFDEIFTQSDEVKDLGGNYITRWELRQTYVIYYF